jgi:hypothetical protein
MGEDHRIVPVWFFVGVILLIYGLLIVGSGISQLSQPPTTVLGELRPAVWWGAFLTVLGAVYVYLFRPKKS